MDGQLCVQRRAAKRSSKADNLDASEAVSGALLTRGGVYGYHIL